MTLFVSPKLISKKLDFKMANSNSNSNNKKKNKPLTLRFSSLLVLIISILLLSSSTAFAKSRRPISDAETRQKKNECYADIESGMWGWQCKSSVVDKENCALKCLSPSCYELVYGSDPLEEGEKDLIRSQEFKYCMHKLSLGESLEGIKGSFDY